MELVAKVKGLLSEPLDTFDALKEETPKEAMIYFATIASVYSVFSAMMSAIIFSMLSPLRNKPLVGMIGSEAVLETAISAFLISAVSLFLWGVILHIFAYLLGGRNHIIQTIKAVIYGSTPGLLFGWIPVFGIIGHIWSSVLMIIGIRQYQGLTTGRSILAVLIPILIVLIAVLVVVAAVVQLIISMYLPG